MLGQWVGWAVAAFLVLAWFVAWHRTQWVWRSQRTLDTAVRLPPSPSLGEEVSDE